MTTDSNCSVCVHYQGALRCLAFPQGIPAPIIEGRKSHTKPMKGDKGILFEMRKEYLEAGIPIVGDDVGT